MNQKNTNTQKIVGLGLFTAIVVVLQLLGSFIKFGTFSVSLVLVPVVIGAALYGATAGAWLGFVFGVVVLLSGDAAAFLGVNALGTVLTVLVRVRWPVMFPALSTRRLKVRTARSLWRWRRLPARSSTPVCS